MSFDNRNARILRAALDRLTPYLPEGVTIEVGAGKKWASLAARDSDTAGPVRGNSRAAEDGPVPGSSAFLFSRGLGSWIPFLPRSLRRRLAAQDAVEQVLDLAYCNDGSREVDGVQCNVRAQQRDGSVIVSYHPPDEPQRRIEVSFPVELFD